MGCLSWEEKERRNKKAKNKIEAKKARGAHTRPLVGLHGVCRGEGGHGGGGGVGGRVDTGRCGGGGGCGRGGGQKETKH